MSDQPFHVGFLLFPDLTQLDLTGPFEVLARMPGCKTHLIAHTLDPVTSDTGLTITPTTTMADCPSLDMICVPGGPGMNRLLTDAEVLDFLREQTAKVSYITSVCTGSLVLGAAGLLKGRRAATHWMSRDMLTAFGAEPVAERVVVDGNLITGGGVTAGIDFGLRVIAEVRGPAVAQAVQLGIEYAPDPPFNAGSPETADPAIVETLISGAAARQKERTAQVRRATDTLAAG